MALLVAPAIDSQAIIFARRIVLALVLYPAETEVLAGARRLFGSKCIDYVIIAAIEEVASESWHKVIAALRQLAEFGYEPCVFGYNGTVIPIRFEQAGRGGTGRNILMRRRGLGATNSGTNS